MRISDWSSDVCSSDLRIAREMGLFHLQEEAHGSVFWHPNGYIIWQALEQYMRRRLDSSGYQEIKTPQLMDARLWEASGHWRSEEHTSELQSLMRISYAVFCLKKKITEIKYSNLKAINEKSNSY